MDPVGNLIRELGLISGGGKENQGVKIFYKAGWNKLGYSAVSVFDGTMHVGRGKTLLEALKFLKKKVLRDKED